MLYEMDSPKMSQFPMCENVKKNWIAHNVNVDKNTRMTLEVIFVNSGFGGFYNSTNNIRKVSNTKS